MLRMDNRNANKGGLRGLSGLSPVSAIAFFANWSTDFSSHALKNISNSDRNKKGLTSMGLFCSLIILSDALRRCIFLINHLNLLKITGQEGIRHEACGVFLAFFMTLPEPNYL